MNIQDELLAAMYKSFYADEGRFDVLKWLRDNELGQSAFSTTRDKLEIDIGPGGRNLIDAMSNSSLIEKRVGTEAIILPKGIDEVEARGLTDKALVDKVRARRLRLLEATQRLQAQTADQTKAQVGRVMTEVKMMRQEATPLFNEFVQRGWTIVPEGQKDGWLAITWEGAQALDAMRAAQQSGGAAETQAAPQTPGGPVPLSSIKFFD